MVVSSSSSSSIYFLKIINSANNSLLHILETAEYIWFWFGYNLIGMMSDNLTVIKGLKNNRALQGVKCGLLLLLKNSWWQKLTTSVRIFVSYIVVYIGIIISALTGDWKFPWKHVYCWLNSACKPRSMCWEVIPCPGLVGLGFNFL